jgi:hypothetical protein
LNKERGLAAREPYNKENYQHTATTPLAGRQAGRQAGRGWRISFSEKIPNAMFPRKRFGHYYRSNLSEPNWTFNKTPDDSAFISERDFLISNKRSDLKRRREIPARSILYLHL